MYLKSALICLCSATVKIFIKLLHVEAWNLEYSGAMITHLALYYTTSYPLCSGNCAFSLTGVWICSLRMTGALKVGGLCMAHIVCFSLTCAPHKDLQQGFGDLVTSVCNPGWP